MTDSPQDRKRDTRKIVGPSARELGFMGCDADYEEASYLPMLDDESSAVVPLPPSLKARCCREVFVREMINEANHLGEALYNKGIRQETLHTAVSILDRYLSAVNYSVEKNISHDPRLWRFEFVSHACLWCALKLCESQAAPSSCGMSPWALLTRPTLRGVMPRVPMSAKHSVVEMEEEVFNALKGDLIRPSPVFFLEKFLRLSQWEDEVGKTSSPPAGLASPSVVSSSGAKGRSVRNTLMDQAARFFLDLTLVRSEWLCVRPSLKAAASVMLARKLCCREGGQGMEELVPWPPLTEKLSGISKPVQLARMLIEDVRCVAGLQGHKEFRSCLLQLEGDRRSFESLLGCIIERSSCLYGGVASSPHIPRVAGLASGGGQGEQAKLARHRTQGLEKMRFS